MSDLWPDASPDDAGDSYSVKKFYTRSRDGKGGSASTRVNIAPELASRISILVASRIIPAYGTMQDVLRDAAEHRLHYIEGLEVLPGEWVAEGRAARAREDVHTLNLRIGEQKKAIKGCELLLSAATESRSPQLYRSVVSSLTALLEQDAYGNINYTEQLTRMLERAQMALDIIT